MSGDRDKVLARIREALKVPSPEPHEGGSSGHGGTAFRAWLPPVGEALEDQIGLFAKQSEVLKTEFVVCASESEAAAHLSDLALKNDWKLLAWHPGQLNSAVLEHGVQGVELVRIEAGYDPDALEACDAGLTECEALVAQTGSVLVSSLSSGGRALSVLPHHHVVLARSAQVVSDLAAAYEGLALRYPGELPSFLSFISGPSRTGDIERILVLGAHGPKKMTVLLVP